MTSNVLNPDESSLHLHVAGWTLDEAAVAGPAGVTRAVTGSSGARRIRAEGPTRITARWAAGAQVTAGGRIRSRQVPRAMGG